MSRRRPILLLTLTCALLSVSLTRAQAVQVPPPEEDEAAATAEARRGVLNAVLAAVAQARELGDTLQAARLLNRAGRLRLKLNSPEEALDAYRQARALLAQTPDPTTRIDSLNGLGAAYKHLSQCDPALPALRRAIALSERGGYVAGKAEALLTLSDCQNFRDHALALQTAREAMALWQSLNDRRWMARTHSAIGHYLMAQSNVTEATRSHEAALLLWSELGVAEERAEALINLGFIEYRKGAWQNALTFFAQAQDLIDEKAEPYMMGQITGGLADAFLESGMPDAALPKFQQALEYYRLTQNPRAVAAIVWSIGRTQLYRGNHPEALESLQSALAYAEPARDHVIAAMSHDMLGQTLRAMNDPDAALLHFETAFGLYIKVGNSMEAARVRALEGQIHLQRGDVERARAYYLGALATFRALSDHVNEAATLHALGCLELEQNNLSLAEDYLGQSIAVTENMRRVSTSRDLTAAFSATVHERYEKYAECLMRQHDVRPDSGLAVRAFETSEQARGRSLAELLRATQTNLVVPGLDPKLAEQERSLRQALWVKEDSRVALLNGTYKKEELAALDAEVARLEAEFAQVTEVIRARYPAYEQMTRPAAWDLRRIQEEVIADDQTVLLEFLLGADRSYVWAVTRDHVRSYELPPRARIDAAAEKAYRALADRPGVDDPDPSVTAALELSRLILSPVAAELSKRRLIVVADGALNYIPFQVLPPPSGGEEPLVAGHEIVNAHSATILGELRQEAARRRPAARTLAAFGYPASAADYAQLRDGDGQQGAAPAIDRWRKAVRDIRLGGETSDPSAIRSPFYTRRELAHLLDVTAGEETLVASEYDATRERLFSTDLTQYAILHFATHGLLDTERPEFSGLLLSTVDRDGRKLNGFVGLQNIYELRAPVNLVVLSACQTALGKDVRGEGLMGLTRGFMYAGASSVVASLWKVDDEATAELMRQFYSNMLRDGATPSEALRAAQNQIRQTPGWHAPFYWAAFTLQGEHQQVIRPARAARFYTKALWGTALLMLLAGLGWWYLHRRRRRMRAAVEAA